MTAMPDVERLERCEMAAWEDLYGAAPEDLARSLGLLCRRSGPLLLLGAGATDVLAANRAVGAGLEEPLSPDRLTTVREAFAGVGAPRYFFQVAPGTYSQSARVLLESHGLTHHNNWVRLQRSLDEIPDVVSRCSVREIGPADAGAFAEIVAACFGWPLGIGTLMASGAGRPGWKCYVAEAEGQPVATGALFVSDETAWLGGAATLPSHRGLGAQKLLVRRRLEDARALGCTLAVAETAELTPQKDAPSFRNLIRLGFIEAYLRPNYICTLPVPQSGIR